MKYKLSNLFLVSQNPEDSPNYPFMVTDLNTYVL